MTKGTEIVLPKCPVCGHVGAIPLTSWTGKISCGGPKDAQHTREKMIPTAFVEKRSRA